MSSSLPDALLSFAAAAEEEPGNRGVLLECVCLCVTRSSEIRLDGVAGVTRAVLQVDKHIMAVNIAGVAGVLVGLSEAEGGSGVE